MNQNVNVNMNGIDNNGFDNDRIKLNLNHKSNEVSSSDGYQDDLESCFQNLNVLLG